MYFERFISLRYLRAKRKHTFISMISVISMVGVALGVCALIVVLSVMNGFQKDIRDRILGVYSHISITSHQGVIQDYPMVISKAEKLKGVKAAAPFIYSQGMLSYGGRVTGTVIRGVDPDKADKVTNLAKSVRSKNVKLLSQKMIDPRKDKDNGNRPLPSIIIGVELARNLGTNIGEVVRLISPVGRMTPMGRSQWHQDYVVVDLFRSGMYEYDTTMCFLSLDEARLFLGMKNGVTGVEIKFDDIYMADEISDNLQNILGLSYFSRDWMRMNRNLFSALKLEKLAMFIILVLIVLVAAFNIISTLIMAVMEKTKDIAILKAIGARSKSIMRIFIYQGVAIGLVGTGIGLVSGLVICELLKRYQFIQLPKDIYYLDTLPVRVDVFDVSLVVISSIAISFIATIYPSRQASRQDPVEALRYE